MSILTIQKGNHLVHYEYTPPCQLEGILENAGFSVRHPCGGHGLCGKCVVDISGHISEPTPVEIKLGCRLACQTEVFGNATVILPKSSNVAQIQMDSSVNTQVGKPMKGTIGAAVDIGTTTLALRRYDLHSGMILGQSAMENPQCSISADVIGRIDAAMNGNLELLHTQICNAIDTLLLQAGGPADTMVAVGNTTMLYLLTGRDPTCLSKAPFHADCLFDLEADIASIPTYLPPCMDAFVGADISCAVLASGMCMDKTSLLCDIGTNGEIALWKNDTLYVTATAAGPAFEGAGISCGCNSVPGSIDRVWIEENELRIHTIDDHPAVGICGSGIIDATANLLASGIVEETGLIDPDPFMLAPNVSLSQKDIRMIQLAKSAIAAGIQTLMEISQTSFSEIEHFYIAGGFGSHMDVENAAKIGLIPSELVSRTQVLGNAALAGASRLLLCNESNYELRRIVNNTKYINLSGNPTFNSKYIEQMMF